MRHLREDYDAIQPWPVKRPHHGLVTEEDTSANGGDLHKVKYLYLSDDSLEQLGDSVEPIIPDDEPVFIIRAKDLTGPDTVRFWADNAERQGAEHSLCERVREWAQEMENWGSENLAHVPDVEPEWLRS